jgi:hypothetical protein
MIALLLQLATATPATSAPNPIATPLRIQAGQTRTLADVARERKGQAKPKGSFSAAVGGGEPRPTMSIEEVSKCGSSPYHAVIDDAEAKFQSETATAGQTPRMSLAAQISRMQDVRNKFDGVAPAECAERAKALLVRWMDASIVYYRAFLGKSSATTLQQLERDTEAAADRYHRERRSLPW